VSAKTTAASNAQNPTTGDKGDKLKSGSSAAALQKLISASALAPAPSLTPSLPPPPAAAPVTAVPPTKPVLMSTINQPRVPARAAPVDFDETGMENDPLVDPDFPDPWYHDLDLIAFVSQRTGRPEYRPPPRIVLVPSGFRWCFFVQRRVALHYVCVVSDMPTSPTSCDAWR
jgi:hypothetical protein